MRPILKEKKSLIERIRISYKKRLELIQSEKLTPYCQRELAIGFYISWANPIISEIETTIPIASHPLYQEFKRMYDDLDSITKDYNINNKECEKNFEDVNP